MAFLNGKRQKYNRTGQLCSLCGIKRTEANKLKKKTTEITPSVNYIYNGY